MNTGRGRSRSADERGAGSVLVVALVAVIALAGLTALGGAHALVRGQRLSAAADAAALAAGDALLGWVAGEPCTLAQRVAEAHAVRLAECSSEGLTVLVRVESSILGLIVSRSARAGPPEPGW
ncbi:Rv3654c family TadE-like protein [Microcella sp.]|uniref:Rv3654c family TadE-like protein n=1 Tax=Microcella sp. TaxID=1913979 RepID=UPI003F6F8C2B